jgi:Flp pilus assembly protein TadG
MTLTPNSRVASERGQTAVEFALVAPVLVAVMLAVIQFAIAFHDYVTLTDAARAGARKAIVARFANDPTQAIADAGQAVRDSAGQLKQSDLGVLVTDPDWTTSGSVVTVTATYPYAIDIPLIGVTIASGSLTAIAKERLE